MSYPQLLTPEEKLADAKKLLSLPRIVVICGSTRFMTEMNEADLRETKAGKIVVKPGCDMKSPHELWSDPVEAEALKVRLDDLHRAKIRLADEVLVVGDYIGDSTRAEIAYARSLGKPVRFTHPEVDPDADRPLPPRQPGPEARRLSARGGFGRCSPHTLRRHPLELIIERISDEVLPFGRAGTDALVLFHTTYTDAAVTQQREDGFEVRDEGMASTRPPGPPY